MDMRIEITELGGRRVWGDTPLGRFELVTDAAGHVVSAWMQARQPVGMVPTGSASARREICRQCPHLQELTVLTVRCGLCGCAGLSLTSGQCPANKWSSNGD